ncbi:hypothetical protein LIER_10384 [Lithospermum erythrorhizon]|uniref:Uncharacterized protein n=1 Tax=Lithospermum erythrorhizon TaxID=34254 RepID=A0AAV3PJ20_LITER
MVSSSSTSDHVDTPSTFPTVTDSSSMATTTMSFMSVPSLPSPYTSPFSIISGPPFLTNPFPPHPTTPLSTSVPFNFQSMVA